MPSAARRATRKQEGENIVRAREIYFFARTNLTSYQRRALDTHPEERRPARPHEFTCVGPRNKNPRQRKTLASRPPSLRGAPGCQPRDTATGTTPTWPPVSSDGKPTARGLQFLRPRCISATGPPQVTPPEGPIGGGCGRPATLELAHSDAIRQATRYVHRPARHERERGALGSDRREKPLTRKTMSNPCSRWHCIWNLRIFPIQ